MAEWDIDLSEVDGLKAWYGKQPKLMQRASAMLLNNFAFGTRDESIKQIGRLMIVRNPAFVSRQIRVTKASLGAPIAKQQSRVGSIAIKGLTKRGDFTGWTEQEKGTPVQRKRVSTVASRGGDIQRQMLARARLKPANEVVTFGSQGYGKTPRGLHKGGPNYGGWVAMLVRQGYKGLINMKGKFFMVGKGSQRELHGPTQTGRALFKQLVMVQETKRKQPKQKHWLRQARAIYFKKHQPQATWNQTVARLMKPPPKH